jgi:hypothetical protein
VAYRMAPNIPPKTTINPTVTQNATNVPNPETLTALESLTGNAPAPSLSSLIQNTIYGDGTNGPATAQEVQNTLDEGQKALVQAGVSKLDAQTAAGMLTIIAAPQVAASQVAPSSGWTVERVLTNLQIVAPGVPSQSYRPVSGTSVIDLAPVLKGFMTNPSPQTILENGAYIHDAKINPK